MDFASEYSCQKAYSSIRNTINLNISAQNPRFSVYLQRTERQLKMAGKKNKKKKHQLPSDRISNYLLIVLGAIMAVFVIVTVCTDSKKIYTDVADGVVSDVFFASPNQAGDWVRMCEVLYHVDGKEYTIREQCWTRIYYSGTVLDPNFCRREM